MRNPMILSVASVMLVAGSVQASVYFNDTFTNGTVADTALTPEVGSWNNTTKASLKPIADAGSVLSLGTTNGLIHPAGGSWVNDAVLTTSASAAVVSFDFRDMTLTGTDANSWMKVQWETAVATSAGTAVQFLTQSTDTTKGLVTSSSGSGAYDTSTKHHVDIYFNSSGAAIQATDAISVPAGRISAYIDGVFAASGSANSAAGYIRFSTGSSANSSFYVDNILVQSIPVPEPTSLAALGLVALGLRRRRGA